MSTSLRNVAITTGGVAEDILPARLGRSRLIISPITEDLWINFNETAAVDNGELIPSGSSSVFSVEKFPEIGGAVSAFSATTGAKVNIREM
jgi:hypothetical protein